MRSAQQLPAAYILTSKTNSTTTDDLLCGLDLADLLYLITKKAWPDAFGDGDLCA